jgi:hypothetical protein
MLHVRYIDIDLDIKCEIRSALLRCERKAVAEVFTDDDSRYLCRSHLQDYRLDYENKQADKLLASGGV